jgi:hypothetical protein
MVCRQGITSLDADCTFSGGWAKIAIKRVCDIVIAFLSKYKTHFSESAFGGSALPSLDLALLREEITRDWHADQFSNSRAA